MFRNLFLIIALLLCGVPAYGQTPTRANRQIVKANTNTTYTVVAGDAGKLVTLSNASPVAVAIPRAITPNFPTDWFIDVKNLGVGTVTITPTISTIGGSSSLALTTGQSARIISNGTNWLVTATGSASVAFSEVTGSVTDAQVPNTITIDLATLATTATTANAGDSATAFFSAGAIEKARQHANTLYTDDAAVNTALKSFTDGTLKVLGGDYGAAEGSLPGSPVEQTFYLNTNASSRKLYLYIGAAYREIFQSGISGPISVPNGGTGVATLTGIVKGNGTSAFSAATAGTDYVTPSSSETLTNKTLNVESTGNVLTTVHTVWFMGGGCNNATAASFFDLPTSLAPTPTCKTGSNTQLATLDFPDSDGAYSAQTNLALPSDFTGTVDAKIKWKAAATSGDVVWNVATICVADAETDDPSFNTASSVTDTAKGTTLQMNDASITGVTITGCATGEVMHIKVSRDRTAGADTISGVVSFYGLELKYRRAQ